MHNVYLWGSLKPSYPFFGGFTMSYELYRNLKQAQRHMNETCYNAEGKDITNEIIFGDFVRCFNIIADLVRFNKGLPFFNLKVNWALLKKQCWNAVFVNVQNWLLATDSRFDGEIWTEKGDI